MKRVSAFFCIAFSMAACQTTALVKRGNAEYASGQYDKSAQSFELALREHPQDEAARKSLERARAAWADVLVGRIQTALREERYSDAVQGLQVLRDVPLSLDDFDRRGNVQKVTTDVQSKIQGMIAGLVDRGRSVEAMQLALSVGAGSESESWFAGLSQRLGAMHRERSQQARIKGLPGVSALHTALAYAVGDADTSHDTVEAAWLAIRDAHCKQGPQLVVKGSCKDCDELTAVLSSKIGNACPLNMPIKVTLQIDASDRTDRTETEIFYATRGDAARVDIVKITVPDVEFREIDDVDVKIEKIAHRDCAPRPGEERRCREWIEEKRHETPVKRRTWVQTTRQIDRPKPGPNEAGSFPYARDWIQRGAMIRGMVSVTMGDQKLVTDQPFVAKRYVEASEHDAVMADGTVLVPANRGGILDAKNLWQSVLDDLSTEVRAQILAAQEHFVEARVRDAAVPASIDTFLQADDTLVRAVAGGVTLDPGSRSYFKNRYGMGPDEAVQYLVSPRRLSP